MLDPAFVEERLAEFRRPSEPYPIIAKSTYRVHQRVASDFRSGRMLLVGDAAHINNPLGAFGLNGALHGAFNLADKLAAVWRGESRTTGCSTDMSASAAPPMSSSCRRSRSATSELLEERDPAMRAAHFAELRRTAADPVLATRVSAAQLDDLERAPRGEHRLTATAAASSFFVAVLWMVGMTWRLYPQFSDAIRVDGRVTTVEPIISRMRAGSASARRRSPVSPRVAAGAAPAAARAGKIDPLHRRTTADVSGGVACAPDTRATARRLRGTGRLTSAAARVPIVSAAPQPRQFFGQRELSHGGAVKPERSRPGNAIRPAVGQSHPAPAA